jgi:methylated-DNA-[protein]-cysteine S-methyltransferase
MSLASNTILARLDSPLGALLALTDPEGALLMLEFADAEDRVQRLLGRRGTGRPAEGRAPAPLAAALDAYFAGDCAAIDRLRAAADGTPFQRDVWAALRRIPAGGTLSYGELAARLGRGRAVRAVGRANGANPVAIVVPCHRVIGADGTLTGYGGGLERKRWLLDHEQRHARQASGKAAE